MDQSLAYYNENAKDFFDRTAYADITSAYHKFLPLLPEGGHILDFGCGSGRDARYFKNQGFKVTATDGSKELVEIASKHIGQDVLLMPFQELDYKDKFHAVWANAALIHVPYENLTDILLKIHASLKENGIFFASFKYGNEQRTGGERVFYDMDEKTIAPYLHGLFSPIEIGREKDLRSSIAPSPANAWLHILCRKS